MQTYFDEITYEVGQRLIIDNPAGHEECNLLVTHSEGMNLIIYSEQTEADMAQFLRPIGVFGFTQAEVPYLVVTFGQNETELQLAWSMNAYDIPDERLERWLANEQNQIGIWLVNAQTNVVVGGRMLGRHLATALLANVKQTLRRQRDHYYDAEAVESSAEAFFGRENYADVLDMAEDFARKNGCYGTDTIAPKVFAMSLN